MRLFKLVGGVPTADGRTDQISVGSDASISTRLRWRPGQRRPIKPHFPAVSSRRQGGSASSVAITRLLSHQIATYFASSQLKSVLSKLEPQRLPIRVLHRENRYASAKVRAFVDLMIARLRSDKALH